MRNIVVGLVLLSMAACEQHIPFEERNESNTYLGCIDPRADDIERKYRNVIIDRLNHSIRSEQYFLIPFMVIQAGLVADLDDTSDPSAYKWEKETDALRMKFELHRTTLKLKERRRVPVGSEYVYGHTNYSCELFNNYETYKTWENSILEELEAETLKRKLKAEAAEKQKKI